MLSDGPSNLRLYGSIALMTTLWSSNYIVAKFALREFPAVLASGIRMMLAGLIMIAVYRWRGDKGKLASMSGTDKLLMTCLGVLGVGLNQFLFVLGISMTTVSHAAIMVGLTPVTVLLLAWAMGMEALGILRILGMFTALAGVTVLQLSSSQSDGASLRGDVLVYLACLTFAFFTVRSKRDTARLDGVVLYTFAYVGTALAMLPVTVGYSRNFAFSQVTSAAWLSLLYMAVFPSVVCYLIYNYALAHVPASRIAAFAYLQPLLAMLMAIPLLGERPTSSLLSGGALVLTGVFLAERG